MPRHPRSSAPEIARARIREGGTARSWGQLTSILPKMKTAAPAEANGTVFSRCRANLEHEAQGQLHTALTSGLRTVDDAEVGILHIVARLTPLGCVGEV